MFAVLVYTSYTVYIPLTKTLAVAGAKNQTSCCCKKTDQCSCNASKMACSTDEKNHTKTEELKSKSCGILDGELALFSPVMKSAYLVRPFSFRNSDFEEIELNLKNDLILGQTMPVLFKPPKA